MERNNGKSCTKLILGKFLKDKAGLTRIVSHGSLTANRDVISPQTVPNIKVKRSGEIIPYRHCIMKSIKLQFDPISLNNFELPAIV